MTLELSQPGPTLAGVDDQPTPTIIEYVRPGRTALAWLAQSVAELKCGDPLRPVTVIVPNYVLGRFARRHLARAGGFIQVNVRTLRMVELAANIAPPPVEGRDALDPILEASAVRAALMAADTVLTPLAHQLSVHDTLLTLFREIRRQELHISEALELQPSAAAGAALRTYQVFREKTTDHVDATELRDIAAQRLSSTCIAPRSLTEIGAVILFLPTRVDPADARLVAALARCVPVRAALAWVDDDHDTSAGQIAQSSATMLADVLGQPAPTPASSTSGATSETEIRVIRAPDPAEEAREVVRAIAADLESGVPLYRIAVLYRQTDPYAAQLRESVRLAGLPWFGLGGNTLAESAPGRALLSVLGLLERNFARAAVLEWVDAAPHAATATELPASAWDRLSRLANVVLGADQWRDRLETFAHQQEIDAVRRERDGMAAWANSLRHQSGQARAIAATVARVALSLQGVPGEPSWAAFATWAEDIWRQFASTGGAWPGDDERAAELVAATIAELGRGDRFDGDGASLPLFLDMLRNLLETRSLPEGRLGEGVLIGPVQSATGLAFDRVYVLGLTEGTFPPTPVADPFFPLEDQDPLERRSRQRAAEREQFLAAMAAGDGGRVTLSAPDALADRAAFPSRWLLEVASQLQAAGVPPLDAMAFRGLAETDNAWLRVVASPEAGVARSAAAADLEDRRLREAISWRRRGHSLDRHPIAARAELPVGRGLQAMSARRSDRFTAFDGNLAEVAANTHRLRRLVDGSGAVSATSLQVWAGCPFHYFMERVVGAEPTELPQESWTIDALEKGSLIHRVLELFFLELRSRGRPSPDESYTEGDFALMERLAEEQFEDSARRGMTGHALVWEATRKQVLADLKDFLAVDEAWRRSERLQPELFEQPFGMDTAESWPAVEIAVGDAVLRFRGYIDRVDLSPDGTRAHVFDYKTGRPNGYKDLATDPVLRGRALQMALYTRAAREALGARAEIGGGYWFVTTKGAFQHIQLPPDNTPVQRRLEQTVGLVADGIQHGVFPAVPGAETRNTWENCMFCPYSRVCSASRDQEWERKQHNGCGSFIALEELASSSAAEGEA